VFTGIMTAIIALILKPLGWRISPEDEMNGIDESSHAETAYDLA
jgi:Amt family ammonium transporter